jgi:hypothetical protein
MVSSINLEYIFVRMFQVLANIPPYFSNFNGTGGFLLQTIGTIGIVLSVVLLVVLIYVRVRLIQVEHHGFEEKEAHEHALRHHEEVQAKNPRWEIVVSLVASESDSDWRRAILEADIMLGNLLTERGYVGDTIGDQLKMANPLQFTTLNIAWEAHRMRNAIAHLGEAFPLTERDAKTTIDQYRRVFEEFDYI